MFEFSIYYQFFKDCDENGTLNWSVSNNKFPLFHYYNDNNIDLKKKKLNHLNIIANKPELSKKGWKLPFHMEKRNAEKYNYDLKKKVEFVVKKIVFWF